MPLCECGWFDAENLILQGDQCMGVKDPPRHVLEYWMASLINVQTLNTCTADTMQQVINSTKAVFDLAKPVPD